MQNHLFYIQTAVITSIIFLLRIRVQKRNNNKPNSKQRYIKKWKKISNDDVCRHLKRDLFLITLKQWSALGS